MAAPSGAGYAAMPLEIPESLHMADGFLFARLREGLGDKTAILCGDERLTYKNVADFAARGVSRDRGAGEPGDRCVPVAPRR